MTLTEIRNGIISLLRSEIPEIANITGEDATQTEGNMPLLHIQLMPLSSNNAAAGHFRDKRVLIDIAYMEKLITENGRIYGMLDRLEEIFKPCFRIGDRFFTCDAQMDITDHIGHYKMILQFTDTVPFEVLEPAAQWLRVDWRK